MAGLRSLSGSGSFGLLASYMNDPAIGPDSFTGILLGTIYGSSETTFTSSPSISALSASAACVMPLPPA